MSKSWYYGKERKPQAVFCYRCGSQLQRARTRKGHYNALTGERVLWSVWRCPSIRWWRVWQIHAIEERP